MRVLSTRAATESQSHREKPAHATVARPTGGTPVGCGVEDRQKNASHPKPRACVFPPVLYAARRFAASCDVGLQDAAGDAVFQQPGVEVDQQADSFLHQTHVSQELGFEYRHGPLDTLYLHHHEAFDDEIDAIFAEEMALVIRGERLLMLISEADLVELDAQG